MLTSKITRLLLPLTSVLLLNMPASRKTKTASSSLLSLSVPSVAKKSNEKTIKDVPASEDEEGKLKWDEEDVDEQRLCRHPPCLGKHDLLPHPPPVLWENWELYRNACSTEVRTRTTVGSDVDVVLNELTGRSERY